MGMLDILFVVRSVLIHPAVIFITIAVLFYLEFVVYVANYRKKAVTRKAKKRSAPELAADGTSATVEASAEKKDTSGEK